MPLYEENIFHATIYCKDTSNQSYTIGEWLFGKDEADVAENAIKFWENHKLEGQPKQIIVCSPYRCTDASVSYLEDRGTVFDVTADNSTRLSDKDNEKIMFDFITLPENDSISVMQGEVEVKRSIEYTGLDVREDTVTIDAMVNDENGVKHTFSCYIYKNYSVAVYDEDCDENLASQGHYNWEYDTPQEAMKAICDCVKLQAKLVNIECP